MHHITNKLRSIFSKVNFQQGNSSWANTLFKSYFGRWPALCSAVSPALAPARTCAAKQCQSWSNRGCTASMLAAELNPQCPVQHQYQAWSLAGWTRGHCLQGEHKCEHLHGALKCICCHVIIMGPVAILEHPYFRKGRRRVEGLATGLG